MAERTFKGISAAEGVVVGPAFIYHPLPFKAPDRPADGADGEWSRFTAALDEARAELEALQKSTVTRLGAEHAAIFEAHAMIVADPMLHDAVHGRINDGQTAEASVVASAEELSAMLAGMEDELFAARAIDVMDVGRRLLRLLMGVPDTSLDALDKPSVIVAYDLTPSDTASLRPEYTLGFCTAVGGLTSHTAILARALGIPAVVGLGQTALNEIVDDVPLALDGEGGTVILNPAKGTLQAYKARRDQEAAHMLTLQESAQKLAHNASGRRVEVGANVGDVDTAQRAVENGAEGVGLLRTEFLYLKETRPPSEDKQVEAYKAIFDKMQDRPVIVRTLDIGGDKPPTYLKFDQELNPFLGWRALRICLDDIPLFKTQLRAILRAAVGRRALIMYPMVASLEEVRRANAILEECRAELKKSGIPYAANVPVGIMIEIPSAALMADVLITEVDFFSIGTNDLTQYTLACDRTNERVAEIYQPLHPAVLRLIRNVIDASHQAGKWTGMCGELAGMKKAIPILLGMGLDEFSMNPRSIPGAKEIIGKLTDEDAHQIATDTLSMGTTQEIETYMQRVLGHYGP